MNLRTYLLGAKSSIPEAKRKAIADKESAVIAAQKGRSLPKPDEDTLRSEQIEKQVGSGLTAEELAKKQKNAGAGLCFWGRNEPDFCNLSKRGMRYGPRYV
jgi:hypothetical protein